MSEQSGQFSISHSSEGDGQDDSWMELLANGLTFDLSGLSPGEGEAISPGGQTFGLAPDFDRTGLEAISITPGPHLTGGGALVPVTRCLAWLAAQMSQLPGLRAIGWNPAGTLCAPEYFQESVMRWIGGGVFPGLGLTAIVAQDDGAIQSKGLALFTGQELRLDLGLATDRSEGVKIALRLLHWLVENGRVDHATSLIGPSGETLILEPLADQDIVRVWTGSR